MNRVAEICCGSLEDALVAEKAGADRIELNNAMFLSGLTPSLGTIDLVVHQCNIPIVVMVRPRPGGFFYNPYEFETIVADVEAIAKYDIEGIAFGCLDENGNIEYSLLFLLDHLKYLQKKDPLLHLERCSSNRQVVNRVKIGSEYSNISLFLYSNISIPFYKTHNELRIMSPNIIFLRTLFSDETRDTPIYTTVMERKCKANFHTILI